MPAIAELWTTCRKRAKQFGAEFITDDITRVELRDKPTEPAAGAENLIRPGCGHFDYQEEVRRGIGLHMPLAGSEPTPASIEQIRRVERADVLGGLIHEYHHAA